MKSFWQRICSIYLIIYCGLILPPTGILTLLAYCGLCDPDPAPWLRKIAMLGAVPLIICGIVSSIRSTKKENPPSD